MFKFLTLCILLAVLFVAGTNAIVLGTTYGKIMTPERACTPPADAILVLGASVFADGTPSGILQDRLDQAIALYHSGAAPKIIMSGDGRQTSYNEPAAMKDYAIAHGVPSEDIFCDRAGYSTYDSTYRARHIFGANSLIIVTQSYHLSRALYSAAGMGMDVRGVASDGGPYQRQTYYDLREIPARTKDFLYTLINKHSAILGDPVSLEQSGDVTNDQRQR
ncbi:MAG: YdcF family protein [Eggerthellaceae bacterium]|nr:YdcF family protein [Eggerthellaceae bacterium]